MEDEFAVLAKLCEFDPNRCDVCSMLFTVTGCTVDICAAFKKPLADDSWNPDIKPRKALRKLIAEFTRLKHMDLINSVYCGRLADEVAVLIRRGVIDSRSPAGDALLDFREKPETERSCRLASLERQLRGADLEISRLQKALSLCANANLAIDHLALQADYDALVNQQ